MAVIKSGDSTDQLRIDPTSKAARVTLYDTNGAVTGTTKTTYMAANGMTATAAGTGVLARIEGSSSKIIRVHRIRVSGTVATAAVMGSLIATKRTTLGTGGTSSVLTAVANDASSGAATATARYYTALGVTGTGGGIVAATGIFLPITATPSFSVPVDFTPQVDTGRETEDWVLRSANQSIELSFSATTTNVPTLSIWMTWTEE